MSDRQWCGSGLRKQLRKFKTVFSTRKVMCTTFWDRQGIICKEYMAKGTTITTAIYCEILKNLCTAIKNRWPGLLQPSIILFHNNKHPHSARMKGELLKKIQTERFRTPPVLSWPGTIWFCIIPRSKGCFERATFFVGCRSWIIYSQFFFSQLDGQPGNKNSYTGMIHAWTVKLIMSKNDT